MNGPESSRLTDELDRGAHRFEELGGRDLGLEEVLGRARGIRRRRRAGVALAAAAVVAAVAVPVGLSTGGTTTAPPLPASSVTPQPIQRIGLGDLPVGSEPSTGWVEGHTWHSPSGKVLAINAQVGEVRSIAPIGQGAVVSMARTDGTLWAWFLHDDGRFEELGSPVEGGLARSPQGHVVVFATASGSSVGVVEDGGHTVTSVDVRGRSNGSFQAAAVIGEHCVAQRDCTIWLNDLGRTPAVLTARAGLAGTFVPRIQTLADVSSRGLRAGIVSRSDTGTCSEVQDGDGQQLWETCRVRLLSFSPDASRLLATSAYGDGLGDTELSVFDARTGHPQLDLRTTRGAVITQMVWEDDSHVLASVMQAGKAAVVRIGLDGRAEYAVPPVPQHGDVNPFVLPVS